LADKNGMKTSHSRPNKRHAFTLIELMVVILIVGILAAAVVSILRGRVDNAKWAEANAAAGMIRNAVKVLYAESGTAITGSLADASILNTLGIGVGDLTGTYFVAADYTIDSVDSGGVATVTVTGSLPSAPTGSKTLKPNGDWE
jgi:prepilin-type N-terminal cleavage/methylation domain-containing protein